MPNISALAAMPQEVTVKILQAFPKMSSIVLAGPVEMVSPAKRMLPAGLHEIRSKGGAIEVLIRAHRASRPDLVKAPSLSFRAIGRGLNLRFGHEHSRFYQGTMRFSADPAGNLMIINKVSAKDYVRSVTASETDPFCPLEALKAQAILTQTRLQRYKPGDELNDTTEGEAYLGSQNQRTESNQAVNEAWGKVLVYDNVPIPVFYHSTCAGRTSGVEAIFGGKPIAAYKSIVCNHCRKSPFWKPTVKKIPLQRFTTVFKAGVPKVVSRDQANRPTKVMFPDGSESSGYQFWLKLGQNLGWDKAPGTRFDIKTDGDQVVISSTGAGHGIGLCQRGAQQMAVKGKKHEEILDFYLPGTKIRAVK